ncbi:L,D-transpeptidase family protein [Pelagibacteraceae bacterium]|jgi:L,D-peptidoglycan transpeptidase YkuD (ErfK/YbiS/YcfS/YnhG family)|nr:L,D-transpeptidase family protein [Pelagibacteraceae bacterium]
MHIFIKNKKLFLNHYKIKCALGKRGIGVKKSEGDQITPKGKFKITRILYRKDRIHNFKCKITKLSIKKEMGWCDDPLSKYYNKLIRFPFKYSAEKLYRKDATYDLILVLNYNLNPVRKAKGSAIFIHVAKKNYKETLGCIAVSKRDLKKIVKKINKSTNVNIS